MSSEVKQTEREDEGKRPLTKFQAALATLTFTFAGCSSIEEATHHELVMDPPRLAREYSVYQDRPEFLEARREILRDLKDKSITAEQATKYREALLLLESPDSQTRSQAVDFVSSQDGGAVNRLLFCIFKHDQAPLVYANAASSISDPKLVPIIQGELIDRLPEMHGKALTYAAHALLGTESGEAVRAIRNKLCMATCNTKDEFEAIMELSSVMTESGDSGFAETIEVFREVDGYRKKAIALYLDNFASELPKRDRQEVQKLIVECLSDSFLPAREGALLCVSTEIDSPQVAHAVRSAIADKDVCYSGLIAAKSLGTTGIQILQEFLDVDRFESLGIEVPDNSDRKVYGDRVSYSHIANTTYNTFLQLNMCLPVDRQLSEEQISVKLQKMLGERGVQKLLEDYKCKREPWAARFMILTVGGKVLNDFVDEVFATQSAEKLKATLRSYGHQGKIIRAVGEGLDSVSRINVYGELLDQWAGTPEEKIQEVSHVFQKAQIYQLDYLAERISRNLKIRGELLEGIRQAQAEEKNKGALSELANILELHEKAEKFGIMFPFRYGDCLDVILKNRAAVEFDSRKIATIVAPQTDYNLAFSSIRKLVRSFEAGGYCVLLYEADTDSEVLDCFKAATQKPDSKDEKKSTIQVWAGHGDQESVRVGSGSDESSEIDLGDYKQFGDSSVSNTLADGGHVILVSCSTGKGGPKAENVATMFRKLFPQAKHIWAPTEPTNIEYVVIGAEGELVNVKFYDDSMKF